MAELLSGEIAKKRDYSKLPDGAIISIVETVPANAMKEDKKTDI